jgi:4'-phosphopantetheinyl transferase
MLPPLAEGCIHVWCVRLHVREEDLESCETILSRHELERANRFRFAHLRRNFLLTHGCLRVLLAHYLGMAAKDVPLTVESSGKPRIDGQDHKVQFNQSDSRELAAFAVSLGRELGIDIEAIRTLPNLQALASRFFSPEETNDLLSLPAECRSLAFFAAWTRKEAYVKALGDGLRIPLDMFRVTVRPDDAPGIVHIGGDMLAARPWRIREFYPAEGYGGAIAYRGDEMELQVHATITVSDLLGWWQAQGAR